MIFRCVLAILSTVCLTAPAYPQKYEKLKYRTYEDTSRFTISIPEDWTEEKSDKFAVIFYSKANDAYCTVKRTVDWSFGVMTNNDYVKHTVENRKALVELLPLQFTANSGKLLTVAKFPIGDQIGAIIVTSGLMNDQNITSSTYQIINASALHTVGCYTLSENIGYYFPIFSTIGGSLTFSEITK